MAVGVTTDTLMWIMVDVEATGPAPGLFSMFWFGAVVVEDGLKYKFEGKLAPLAGAGCEGGTELNIGLKLAGVTHDEILGWPNPAVTMVSFDAWLAHQSAARKDSRLQFVSDNNGYDAAYINWYFHYFLGRNPFGHSSANLGSLYKGLTKSVFENFKHMRKTAHTHNPVDDATGNAEAMLEMRDRLGMNFGKFKLPVEGA